MPKRVSQRSLPTPTKGEAGSCPCCNEATPIVRWGLDYSAVRGERWVVPEELVARVYADLSDPETVKRRQAQCVLCELRTEQPLRILDYTHYWFGPVDEHPDDLIGPACSQCVERYAMELEDASGRLPPLVAYEFKFTPGMLDRLARSDVFKEAQQPPPEIVTKGRLF